MNFLHSPRVWMALFLGLGLFASAYLLIVYVTGGPILCGSSGCETVRSSSWAFIGPLPRPALGVAFYTSMLLILVGRAISPWKERTLRLLTMIGAFLGLLESIHLFFIQWLWIHAFCAWCLTSGFATLVVAACELFDRSSLTEEQRLRDLKGYAFVYILLILVGAPALWLLLHS